MANKELNITQSIIRDLQSVSLGGWLTYYQLRDLFSTKYKIGTIGDVLSILAQKDLLDRRRKAGSRCFEYQITSDLRKAKPEKIYKMILSFRLKRSGKHRPRSKMEDKITFQLVKVIQKLATKKWLTSAEIANKFGGKFNRNTVSWVLNILYRLGYIERKAFPYGKNWAFKYKILPAMKKEDTTEITSSIFKKDRREQKKRNGKKKSNPVVVRESNATNPFALKIREIETEIADLQKKKTQLEEAAQRYEKFKADMDLLL